MSEIRVTTVSDTAGTGPVTLTKQNAAKMYVNFSGSSVAVQNTSLNVSSLDDDGTGQYGVNFTSAMSNATYTALVSHDNGNAGSTGRLGNFHTYSTTSADIDCFYVTSSTLTQDDPAQVVALIQGDLA